MNPRPPSSRAALRIADVCNLAGVLTLARLPLALAFPFFAARPAPAVAITAAALITDILDGVVARRTGTQSHTGAFIDAWMDKIFFVQGAWSLALVDAIPAWWMLCWFSRELIQIPMFWWMVGPYWRGEIPAHHARLPGKITTWSLAVAFIASILGWTWLAGPLTPIVGLAGVITGIGYLRRDWPPSKYQATQKRP